MPYRFPSGRILRDWIMDKAEGGDAMGAAASGSVGWNKLALQKQAAIFLACAASEGESHMDVRFRVHAHGCALHPDPNLDTP